MNDIFFQKELRKFKANNKNNEGHYLRFIKDLVEELKSTPYDLDKCTILRQIKEVDRAFFAAQGTPIEQEIHFTRHGLCSGRQKKGGLEPNAGLEDSALLAMQTTSAFTSSLLHAQAPQIVVSPMVRALQTAAKIVPGDPRTSISINPILAENSFAPSGTDVRNKQHLQEVYEGLKGPLPPTKGFFNTIKAWILNIVSQYLFYRTLKEYNDYDGLTSRRTNAINELKGKSDGLSDADLSAEANRKVSLTSKDKIVGILALIQKSDKVLWLIGHGKNFKEFFKETMGNKASFDYGETRILYNLNTKSKEPKFVAPPYSVKINQESGEPNIEFTGKILHSNDNAKQAENGPVIATPAEQNPGSSIGNVAGLSALRRLSNEAPKGTLTDYEANKHILNSTDAVTHNVTDTTTDSVTRDENSRLNGP